MKTKEFEGKRLLYLGGISRAKFVVQRARELGAYVIVADYNVDSPAKVVADEGVLVDAMDVDAIISLCLRKSVDGIMTGYCDILLPICKEVASRIGMPCYYTDDMLKFTMDKSYFKIVCARYNVPCPKSFKIDKTNLERAAEVLNYPLFIKPIDASGSRGANACYNKDEFVEKYNIALSCSPKGRVSVEECLNGTAFILDYIVRDGEARLLSMADCYVRPGRPSAINSPDLMILPSKELKRYYSVVDSNVKDLFRGEQFTNGLFFFQGYANESNITFFESGCRLGGTWPYIDEYYNKINPMDMLFRHALTGNMSSQSDFNKIHAEYGGMAAIIYFLSKDCEGEIAQVEGVEDVKNYEWVVHLMQYYFPGDKFDSLRQTDVRFLAVHLVAKNFDELKYRIRRVYSMIKYYDKNGANLLAPAYSVECLSGYDDIH